MILAAQVQGKGVSRGVAAEGVMQRGLSEIFTLLVRTGAGHSPSRVSGLSHQWFVVVGVKLAGSKLDDNTAVTTKPV